MSEHPGPGSSPGYVCPYCRLSSDASSPACPNCGAPVSTRELRDDEGWLEQPPIRDLARIQFGQSQCQIAGTYVPVAEMSLAQGDQIYFSHHVLLWADPWTPLAARQMAKGWDRRKAGMPLVMMEAAGPGRIALSDNEPGEIIAVPLEGGQAIEVAEHHFLVATSAVSYDWLHTRTWWALGKGSSREFFYPRGRYVDQFTAQQRGLLLLHACGNVFIRDLREGERIYLTPRALLYKDPKVLMNIHMERPASPRAHWKLIPMIRLTGPGRVAIQSQYEFEGESHYGWDELGPDGSWRNWNSDPDRWRPVIKEREPLYP
jgi:uncharacterized protein (AIM24 family)